MQAAPAELYNVMEAAQTLRGRNCGCGEFSLAVYPSSQPVFADLVRREPFRI